MPSSDYTSAIGGGLKLKGTSGGGIDKKKSKKKKKIPHIDPDRQTFPENDVASANPLDGEKDGRAAEADLKEQGSTDTLEIQARERAGPSDDGKTEAERRYEERRRKRLDERLRREGVQTHKERVENLNKYLSGLSEHHDMPRIGPG